MIIVDETAAYTIVNIIELLYAPEKYDAKDTVIVTEKLRNY